MRHHYFARYFCFSLLLLVSSLSGCQRATYSFQTVPTGPLADAVVPQHGTAGMVMAALPAPAKTIVPAPRRPLRALRRRLTNSVPTAQPEAVVAVRRAATNRVQRQRITPLARYQINRNGRLPDPEPGTGLHRSKAVAIILAVLFGAFGAHRFYLGYYGQGALYLGLTALATFFVLLSFLSLLTAAASFSGLLAVAFVLSLAINGWVISDIVRIITNDLKPRNGDY
jgi:TM2 domain